MSKDVQFVVVQFVLFACYALLPVYGWFEAPAFAKWSAWFFVMIGVAQIIVAMLQLNTKLSPFPAPLESGTLITNGVFKYIRHPIYGGLLLFLAGWGLLYGSGSRLIIVLLLGVLFHYKSRYEEDLLAAKFSAYTAYHARTFRFFFGW